MYFFPFLLWEKVPLKIPIPFIPIFLIAANGKILGQKFVKFFVGFLENLRLSKTHSENNWPLKGQTISDGNSGYLKCSKKQFLP